MTKLITEALTYPGYTSVSDYYGIFLVTLEVYSNEFLFSLPFLHITLIYLWINSQEQEASQYKRKQEYEQKIQNGLKKKESYKD